MAAVANKVTYNKANTIPEENLEQAKVEKRERPVTAMLPRDGSRDRFHHVGAAARVHRDEPLHTSNATSARNSLRRGTSAKSSVLAVPRPRVQTPRCAKPATSAPANPVDFSVSISKR